MTGKNVLAFPKQHIGPHWNTLEGRNNLAYAKQFLTAAMTNNRHTKDGPLLNRNVDDLVFVYGSLKSGFANHAKIMNGTKIGPGKTKSDTWVMQQVRPAQGANYPVIFFKTDDTKGVIAGEVWRIPTADIFELDYLESNGIAYKRAYLPIEMEEYRDGIRIITEVNCWVYFGLKEFWEKRRELLGPIPRIRPANPDMPKYYTWQKRHEYHYADRLPADENKGS